MESSPPGRTAQWAAVAARSIQIVGWLAWLEFYLMILAGYLTFLHFYLTFLSYILRFAILI